ncbi:hypothetical protein [Amycolatopsis sp. H20-H5]|uniref:hypothetical protein n=1 Tax=Amycolatopsis sp. H20-H5 TaxID=3046309 RepID=UPI002DB960E9|nr:hypothetical protein [Amycolatopsis sp. H20-H5]MEC3975852.1 hypothetical protein [Amycolatopsis sp. H20-H5]
MAIGSERVADPETWPLFQKVVGVGTKRDWKRHVRRSDSRRLCVSDERRDPPDVEKLAKVLIGLAREQEPNQTGSHHAGWPQVDTFGELEPSKYHSGLAFC